MLFQSPLQDDPSFFESLLRYEELPSNERGWRWSEGMESWLVEDGEFLRLSMLDGDVHLPKVKAEEPLRAQDSAFLRAVREGTTPKSDGAFATGVVRVLAQIERCL